MKKVLIFLGITLLCAATILLPDFLMEYMFGTGTALATIYTPGCGTPPPPTCQDCPTKELGRVRGFWVEKADHVWTDITNPTEWETAICAGTVFVFPYANGTAEQAEQLSDGYGNVPQTLDSYEYTLNVHEPQYKNNIPFWNFVKRSNAYKVGYKTETLFHRSDVAAMFFPKAPVSADIKSKIDINIMIKFVQEDLIVPVTAGNAERIFTQCVDC